MRRLVSRRLLGSAAIVAAVVVLVRAGSAAPSAATSLTDKLRGDLALLVDGSVAVDPRIAAHIPALQAGEIPFFAVLSEPNDAAHAAQLTGLGATVLRSYRTVDAFALAASPAAVQAIAALPWVSWLLPVELITALDHEAEVDQTRGTPIDIGATALWNQGLTGQGVKIAVLDTGLATHPDLDDLDFRHWSSLTSPAKVLDARNFVGGGCLPGASDGHGHGTHVAGIAAGTGEGTLDTADDGKYVGVAPGASLIVGKVMSDAGAGVNSDLVGAMEAMALPADPANCAFGADIVNMSLGSEARPNRLNTGSDISCGDVPVSTAPCSMVAFVLDRLAVRYGTLFVSAAGNSGPFVGSHLEAPGAAAQTLSVSATAKDYDVNHNDTASGDFCAGWRHPPSALDDCPDPNNPGDQPPSLSTFTSRGPTGDVWGKPDVAAPGYNIVAPQASTGSAIAANDFSPNTANDPLYATATGTSMAAPATAGAAAILLGAYRVRHGSNPSGGAGVKGVKAPWYVLARAALMNTAGGELFDARWISNLFPIVPVALFEARNKGADPFAGPLAEGAGKIALGRAVTALRDGIVVYSAAASTATAGLTHPQFQGSWQARSVSAGTSRSQRFIVHNAPGAPPRNVSFSIVPGQPSDGSQSIPLAPAPGAWSVTLPLPVTVQKETIVSFKLLPPSSAPAGIYTATILVHVDGGQTLRIPVFASVDMHDRKLVAGKIVGPQARIVSGHDVYAKDDTSWPSAAGTPGTGSNADWLVYPVKLAAGLASATFSVYDATAAADETYDIYVYDAAYDLIASSHPFASPGVTDVDENDSRGPSTVTSPTRVTLTAPAAGRHYVVVSRAKIGGTTSGDFGAFVLSLDEAL